jgi:adenosylcobinamide-GDP ribazoletransferase
MKRFLIALQFLTIFPVKINSAIKEKDFGASLLYFPFIGLLIGLILFLSSLLFSFLPVFPKGALILIISIVITGGIHLDGFADTCDGFSGRRSQEEILRIMRDSHIGVMGAIGIVTLLLLKFALIVSISQDFLGKSLILMVTFSKWSQGLACLVSKYVRSEGKAKFFIEYVNRKDVIIGGLFTAILFLLMAKLKGIFILALSFLFLLLFIQYVKRKIGGMTGDTIGATSEIAEVLILFFILILGIY